MIGSRLGPYQILAELGSGGMGKVYRAEVTRPAAGLDAGTAVALKVIYAHLLEQEGFFKRFLREAEIGRAVAHENVVRCFDCDATLLDGVSQHYLVMEYVEGQTLRDLQNELERVPEELCRHIGREIAKGLVAIHDAGVVHRDLKPENVLITEDHVVKVMDLGVARLQDEVVRLSQTGAFVGSLEYAAPEQFRSAGGEPDGRADLHSLGVLLYELSTGQHPYRDEDASRVIARILNDEPRKAGDVNPQLSPFFEEVVQTLIAKDRDERFGTAAALVSVLEEGEKSDWWKERAQALRIETKRPLRRIRIPRETALYGRDDDLAKLHTLYEKAKGGDGQVLLIEGEAGIGKTRLVDEFVGRLRQEGEGLNFLIGSYPPGGAATAAGAFSTAYREHFGEEGLDETLQDYLKPTPILIPAFAALLRGETTPTGAEPLTKDSLQTVFVHATRGLAAERTTIVLIDDLHFAPEDGRALFASLSLAVPGHRILLIGTMRPGVPEEWTAGITRLDHAEQRRLARLGPKDLSRLLIDAFKSERLATGLGLQIAQKSDGNPFFAFEIIRGLREGQFIGQQPDGTWVTTKVIQDIQVPSSVLDLVNARVADLSDGERDLLDVASCCGFEFDPSLVGEVLDLGRISALKRFGQIERRHRLVRSVGRGYVFDHHQVQEALYGSLNEQLREEYHAAVAEVLEVRTGASDQEPKELDGPLCVDLCEHYLKGARGDRALRYLPAALSHLEAGYLNDQALTLADGALDRPGLLGGVPRLRILLRKHRLLARLGRREVQEAVLAEARALGEQSGEKAAMAQAAAASGEFLASCARHEEAREQLHHALAIARETGDRFTEANAVAGLSYVSMRLGRAAEALAYSEQRLAIGRELGHRPHEAAGHVDMGADLGSLGRSEEALDHLRRGLAICEEIGHREFAAVALQNLGNLLRTLCRYEEARAYHERGLAICREIGYRRGELGHTSQLGAVALEAGDSAAARDHLTRAAGIARETGDPREEGYPLANLGLLYLGLGERVKARELLEQSLAIGRDVGDARLEGQVLCLLGMLAGDEGNGPLAIQLLREALRMSDRVGDSIGVVNAAISLGLEHLRAGATDEARSALEVGLDSAQEQQRPDEIVVALALLANLPGGDPAAAEAALEEAGDAGHTPQARYYVWKVTGTPEHLTEAKRLLDGRVAHAPEEYRESMLRNVRLNREIMEAWAKHGGEIEAEGTE